MTVTDFADRYLMYENMSIWEIQSLPDFFKAHNQLPDIFEEEYGFSYNQINDQEHFNDSDIMVVSKLLDRFSDKYFFIFTNDDTHHNALKNLQDRKIINFGMDIYVLHPSRIYILEMDKTRDPQMYDR